jgi:hypothetical protein
MKKNRRLVLHRETIRRLDELRLRNVGAATGDGTAGCPRCLSYEICLESEPSQCVICYESTREPWNDLA